MRSPMIVCSLLLTSLVLSQLAPARTLAADSAKELIEEYTEDINLTRQLLARGLAKESSLAIAYEYRGETYHLYLGESEKAIDDLSQAIKLYDRVASRGRLQGVDKTLVQGNLPRTLLFRSHARRKTGDLSEALKDISRAIKEFRAGVAEGEDTLEPPLAWAHQTRAEILMDGKSSKSRQAVEDLDAAIEILTKWGKRQQSLAKKIPKLQELRKKALSEVK